MIDIHKTKEGTKLEYNTRTGIAFITKGYRMMSVTKSEIEKLAEFIKDCHNKEEVKT